MHCGCLIYQLSIWRVEFLSVATHKQWTFLGIIYFVGRFLICPYLDVFIKWGVATLVISKLSLSLCWTWVCTELYWRILLKPVVWANEQVALFSWSKIPVVSADYQWKQWILWSVLIPSVPLLLFSPTSIHCKSVKAESSLGISFIKSCLFQSASCWLNDQSQWVLISTNWPSWHLGLSRFFFAYSVISFLHEVTSCCWNKQRCSWW